MYHKAALARREHSVICESRSLGREEEGDVRAALLERRGVGYMVFSGENGAKQTP